MDYNLVDQKLSLLWNDNNILSLPTKGNKYIIFSDLHLGNGGPADDFYINETALTGCLKYYLENDFRIILLGDIEELWQFNYNEIFPRYNKTVYKELECFGDRLLRVTGNHDLSWLDLLTSYAGIPANLKNNHPALKLEDENGACIMLLVHGHQGTTDSDKLSMWARFVCRIFRIIEPLAKYIGVYGERCYVRSTTVKDYERCYYRWAKEHKVMICCGHSHRAIFGSEVHIDYLKKQIQLKKENLESETDVYKAGMLKKEIKKLKAEIWNEKFKGRNIKTLDDTIPRPCYFNTGCALYTNGITAIEIEGDNIRLIKWNNKPNGQSPRQIYDEETLTNIIAQVII